MADFHASETALDFDRGFTIDFDLKTGLSSMLDTGKRRLSDMRGMYADTTAYDAMLRQDDTLVYEFHSMPITRACRRSGVRVQHRIPGNRGQ